MCDCFGMEMRHGEGEVINISEEKYEYSGGIKFTLKTVEGDTYITVVFESSPLHQIAKELECGSCVQFRGEVKEGTINFLKLYYLTN